MIYVLVARGRLATQVMTSEPLGLCLYRNDQFSKVGLFPWSLETFDELVKKTFQECLLVEGCGQSYTQRLPKKYAS